MSSIFHLTLLEGSKVSDCRIVLDYIQIEFEKNVLSIYNNFAIEPKNKTAKDLIGRTLVLVTKEVDAFVLAFDDNTQLRIDLRSQAYKGPEALQLNRPGLYPIVWN